MAGRVARRMTPLPAIQSKRIERRAQFAHTIAEIARPQRNETAQHREKSTDCRIQRRILRSPSQVGHLERVSENGNVPKVGQLGCAAGVIGMSVSQKNGGGTGCRTIKRLRRRANFESAAAHPRVYQHPCFARFANEVNVRDAEAKTGDSGRDSLHRHVYILGHRRTRMHAHATDSYCDAGIIV